MRGTRSRFVKQGNVLLAAATFLLVAAATLVAAYVPDQRYEATSVVSVEPSGDAGGPNLVTFLMPSVEARVNGETLAREMAARLPAELARSGWDVQTSVEPGSGVLSITVASDNRDVPLQAANSYAELLDGQLPRGDSLDAVVVDRAQRTVLVSSRSTILVAGFSLAVILAFLVAVSLRPTGRRGSGGPATRDPAVAGPGPAERPRPAVREDSRTPATSPTGRASP